MDVQLLKGALGMNIQWRTLLHFHNRLLSFLESIHDGLKGDLPATHMPTHSE